MGRLPASPKKFKDGFYIEVCDKGAKSGIKISCIGYKEMMEAVKSYERTKHVIIWGEHKDGKWLSEKKVHEPGK